MKKNLYELKCRLALDNVFSQYYTDEDTASKLGINPTHIDLYEYLIKGNSLPDSVYANFCVWDQYAQYSDDDLVQALKLEFNKAEYAFSMLIQALSSSV